MKKLSFAYQFIKTLSAPKVFNGMLVYFSFLASKVSKKPIQWGMPISIAIEPTTACNLGCPECPSGLKQFSRNTGNLKSDFFEKIIGQFAKTTTYLTFYFQGEPYINPKFLEMVRYAVNKNIYTSTSTNGHFLNEKTVEQTLASGLHRLIISIDGTTQEVYENYRIAGNLNKVIAGTELLIKRRNELKKKHPLVIFQFLVVKPNEHQIEEVHRLAEKLGVDEVRLKTAQVYDYKMGNSLIPDNEKYSRYKKLPDGTYVLKNKMVNHCWRLWNSTVITWDGKVVPCCFDKDASHQFGDLQTDTFKQVWQNKAYKNFRTAVLSSRKKIDICSNCSEGTKVWA